MQGSIFICIGKTLRKGYNSLSAKCHLSFFQQLQRH